MGGVPTAEPRVGWAGEPCATVSRGGRSPSARGLKASTFWATGMAVLVGVVLKRIRTTREAQAQRCRYTWPIKALGAPGSGLVLLPVAHQRVVFPPFHPPFCGRTAESMPKR